MVWFRAFMRMPLRDLYTPFGRCATFDFIRPASDGSSCRYGCRRSRAQFLHARDADIFAYLAPLGTGTPQPNAERRTPNDRNIGAPTTRTSGSPAWTKFSEDITDRLRFFFQACGRCSNVALNIRVHRCNHIRRVLIDYQRCRKILFCCPSIYSADHGTHGRPRYADRFRQISGVHLSVFREFMQNISAPPRRRY